jgi:7,8-dihydropterin-6-yl-methyl-4-(beta-D-ribofuranosyl)aminobenzene 5'-phosphate synthase
MKSGCFRTAALAVLILLLAAGGIVLIRLGIANVQVQRPPDEADLPDLSSIGSTRSLTILPLFENAAGQEGLESGHGVSYLIRTDDADILLDVAFNADNTQPSPLMKNMQRLGISPESVDVLVISHNHPDHVGGTQQWLKSTIAYGDQTETTPAGQVFIPVRLSVPGIQPQIAYQPQILSNGAATMGRQPFVQPFPFWLWTPLEYEQSLAINVEGKGIVIITGCGHPTVEKIIERAEAIFDLPVVGVVGGLHYLQTQPEDLQPQIQYLVEREPQLVALSPHDSSLDVIEAFRAAFPTAYQYIQVGEAIHFP